MEDCIISLMCNHTETVKRANKFLIGVYKTYKGTPQEGALRQLLEMQLNLLRGNMDDDTIENLFLMDEIKRFRVEIFEEDSPVAKDFTYKAYVSLMTDIKVHMMSAVLGNEKLQI